MAILKTSPWMNYTHCKNFVKFTSAFRTISYIICRYKLLDFFELPDLPRIREERLKLQIQLVAHTTPGVNRVKVENCHTEDEAFLPDRYVFVDGEKVLVFEVLWKVARRLLKNRSAIYVECFTK